MGPEPNPQPWSPGQQRRAASPVERGHQVGKPLLLPSPNASLSAAGVLSRRSRIVLFAGHLVQHCRQSIEIADEKCSTPAHYNANFCQPIELTSHGLTMSADAACDFGVGWRRLDTGALALARCEARQAQQFGLDAVVDSKCTKFVDALRQASRIAY